MIVLNPGSEPGTLEGKTPVFPDFQTQSTFFPEKFSGKASLKSLIMLKRSILLEKFFDRPIRS